MLKRKLTCSKCDDVLPVSEFHKANGKTRGYSYSCKKCSSIYRRQHHIKNREHDNRTSKLYYESHREEKRQYYRGNGKGVKNLRARQAVNNAIRDGKIPRAATLECSDCGKNAEQYHHESYEKKDYLNVIALCRGCHQKRHRSY